MPVQHRMTHFQIEHAGRTWSGEWTVEGKEVRVDSAYGSERTLIGRRAPEDAAAETLLRMVRLRGQPAR